jgi:cytochrome c-type biogenesis protein CcmH/NrfG
VKNDGFHQSPVSVLGRASHSRPSVGDRTFAPGSAVLSIFLSMFVAMSPVATAADLPVPEERYSDPPRPSKEARASAEKLMRAVALNPSTADNWTNLGWRLYKDGRYAESRWVMSEARARNAKDPYVLWLSGLASYAMGEYKEAHGFLWKVYGDFKTWPNTVDMAVTRDLLGRIAFLNDDLFSAAIHFSSSLEINADNWQTWFFLGVSEWYRERYGEALEALEKARTLKPRHPIVMQYYAHAKLATGERHRQYAKKAAEQQLYPGAEKEANAAAQAYLNDQAVIEVAIEADPANAENYELLGRYHTSLGRTPEAIAAYRKAMSLSPQGAAPPYLLAKALLSTGDASARKEAKQLLIQSVARAPWYWEESRIAPNAGMLIALLLEEGEIQQALALADWVNEQLSALPGAPK